MKQFLNKLLSKVSSLFKDGSSIDWSSARFAFLVSVIISNLAIFGIWVGLSIINNVVMPIDASVLTLYGLANGISFTGKLIQKNMESKDGVQ